MSVNQDVVKVNGHQIQSEVLRKAISKDKGYPIESIKVGEIRKSEGSAKGENFTCVLFALEVEAEIGGQNEKFHYMAKCLPANEYRQEFLKDVSIK